MQPVKIRKMDIIEMPGHRVLNNVKYLIALDGPLPV